MSLRRSNGEVCILMNEIGPWLSIEMEKPKSFVWNHMDVSVFTKTTEQPKTFLKYTFIYWIYAFVQHLDNWVTNIEL